MLLVSLNNVTKVYDNRTLLDGINFGISEGEKIGVIGRNGSGKSTFFKILARMDTPDTGELHQRRGIRVGYLPQIIELDSERTVYEEARVAFGGVFKMLAEYEELSDRLGKQGGSPKKTGLIQRQGWLQSEIDRADGWDIDYRIKSIMSDVGLEDRPVRSLSGGEKKKFEIARLFFTQPDLILLDEPTNHLDIATVEYLEKLIAEYGGAVLVITHDRYFLDRVVDKIIELDAGKIITFEGNYEYYLVEKNNMLANMRKVEDRFRKLLADEEKWIRRGVKARRTRDEGRVKRLESMRRIDSRRDDELDVMAIASSVAKRPGKKVLKATGLTKSYGSKVLFTGLDLFLRGGDRLALIGPNGAGKTTLLNILMGNLQPDSGNVDWGVNFMFAYYEQERLFFDPESTILEEVGKGRQFVEIGGRSRHIYSYLQDFLFRPEQLTRPIKYLSGGEKNRIALANLFLEPANLLILDEPTNDLDITTLQVLEETLVEYPGSIIVVSHDRFFLDKVVTKSLVFDTDGNLHEVEGGYHEAEEFLKRIGLPKKEEDKPVRKKTLKKKSIKSLTYKETKELEETEKEIEILEAQKKSSEEILRDSELYHTDGVLFNDTIAFLDSAAKRLAGLYERWEELESKKEHFTI